MNNLVKKIELDNKKSWLIIMFFLVLIYLDYSFIIKLQFQNLRNIAPKIQKLNSDLGALSSQLAKMQETRSKQTQVKEKALAKAKKIISEEEIPALLKDIADTAKKNEAELIQMKPSREKLAGVVKGKPGQWLKFAPLLIGLDLSCGYHQLGRFINELENKDIFIGLEELIIGPEQKDYFKHKVELTLKAYVENG